nr:DUF4276 family protein [Jiella sonneratiae]
MRSAPRKIEAWRHPADVRFVIARDNDGSDCADLKLKLLAQIPRPFHDRTKVRLVMQELESWYLGDPSALVAAGYLDPRMAESHGRKRKYAEPDRLTNAKQEFARWVGAKGKIAAAQSIGPHLDEKRGRSTSFRHFVEALTWAAAERA